MVRVHAAKALGKLGEVKAVEPLIAALKDFGVRPYAAIALGQIGDKRGLDEAINALINDLNDKTFASVRRTAAIALGEIGDSSGVEPLIAALKDQDEVVRFYAAIALGRIGDRRVIPELERVAKEDKEEFVRNAAKKALEEIASKVEVPTAINPLDKKATTLGAIKRTALLQNFPNPFNPETWIPYELAEAAEVKIQIYDATGKLIRSFGLGLKPAGSYTTQPKAVHWDGKNASGEAIASGVYFYTLHAGKFRSGRRMVVIR
jgi:HEAT repeat protein